MLVYVRTPREEKEGNIHIPIWFPTVLLLNHLTVPIAWVLMRNTHKGKNVMPTLGQLFALLHAVWRCKLRYPLMPLILVDNADGTRVKIRI